MKTRMDFRLEDETKKLVEMAAGFNSMTVSGYMNYLVNQCKDKILDHIGNGFAEIAMLQSLVDIGALEQQDVTEINTLVRKEFVLSLLKESENKEIYKDFYFKEKDMIQKHVKDFVAEYIKNKK